MGSHSPLEDRQARLSGAERANIRRRRNSRTHHRVSVLFYKTSKISIIAADPIGLRPPPSVKNSTKKPSSGRKVPSLQGGRRARAVRRIVSTDKSAKTLVARAPSPDSVGSSLPEGAYKKLSPRGF